jgi:hypothetical protein
MTEQPNDMSTENVATHRPEASAIANDHSVYTYETAGITERQGHVPVWLWIVAIALVIWSIYYLITYWQAPAK